MLRMNQAAVVISGARTAFALLGSFEDAQYQDNLRFRAQLSLGHVEYKLVRCPLAELSASRIVSCYLLLRLPRQHVLP